MTSPKPRGSWSYGQRPGTRHWIEYAALAVACPVCGAEPEHDCENDTRRHSPHWARVAQATVKAAEEAAAR